MNYSHRTLPWPIEVRNNDLFCILGSNEKKIRENKFSRISRFYYFQIFCGNLFSRISRKCIIWQILRELNFANFAKIPKIAKINSRKNLFSPKLLLPKIWTFKPYMSNFVPLHFREIMRKFKFSWKLNFDSYQILLPMPYV